MPDRRLRRAAPTRGSRIDASAVSTGRSRCGDTRRDRCAADRAGTRESEIALGRSNAIKVLGRALREAHATVPFRLVSLDGGKSRNAIPRDAHGARLGRSQTAQPRFATALRIGGRDDPRRIRQDGSAASRSTATTAEGSIRAVDRGARRRACSTSLAVVPTGPTRDEPRLRRSRRDVDVARRGDHRGRPAHAAQPVALFQRLGDAGGDRHARRRRPARRWLARGEAQLQRLASRPRLRRRSRSRETVFERRLRRAARS